MIKNILWDIDGTLLDFLKSERYGIKKCLNRVNVKTTEEMLLDYSRINDEHWKRYELGEISREELAVNRFKVFFDKYKIDYCDYLSFHKDYQKALGEVYFFKDNAFELCKRIEELGYKQYVVTNGNSEVQRNKMKISGLDKIFDGIFISDELNSRKPEKEFFDKVFEKGLNPKESILIGDSLTSDMKGANNAEIKCIWYNPNNLNNSYNIKIDYIINYLWEVLDII